MEGEPSRRLSLLDRCGNGRKNPVVPPRVPSILNLASHKRLDRSKFLPFIHPAPTCFTSSTVSALSPYSEPPPFAPTIEVSSGFGPEDFYSFFPNPFFSMESIGPPPYDALDVPPLTSLALRSVRSNQGPPSRLPLMVGHRRSHSDIPLGYSHQNPQMLPVASVKPKVTMTEGNQSESVATVALKDMGLQAWSPSGSREKEARSSGAGSRIYHGHGLSVDSFMMGNLNFGAVGQQMSSLPLLTTEANGGGGESISRVVSPYAAELANVKFTEDDKKKVVADKSLSEIVLTDPRRVKRILNNRASAAKSKEKKMKYTEELQRKFHVLQSETATLCAQVTVMQKNRNELVSQNNELKTRLQAMDQQAQWGDGNFSSLFFCIHLFSFSK
uniref:BZIP domain-containing protein n=1 Tax=Oryza punctata TaxID=4537 RepID=A0A0E0KMX3_ORYPU